MKIKQHDITDCGAACLASISSYYKLQLPIARIRQYANTNKKGTNILGLVEAAEKLNFEAKGVKGNLTSLSKIPLPAIAHIITKNQLHHFVVIYSVSKTHISIMDPGDGQMHKIKIEDFKNEWTGNLVIMLPTDSFEMGNQKISNLQRFWFLLKPHKFILIQAFLGALVYTLLGFSTSIYVQKITDNILVNGNTNLLNLLSVVMIILLIFQILIGVFKNLFLIKSGLQIDNRLILGYYKHLLKLPQSFFDTMRVGEIISRINDAVKIRTFINGVSLDLSINVLILIFSFALMFFYYWKLALIMLIILPFNILIYFIINFLNKKTERKIMEKGAELESQLVESLNNISTIKSFGIEPFTNLKTEIRYIDLIKISYKSALNSIFSGTSTGFISSLFTIILLWCGSYYVIEQKITPGELMTFYAIIGYFTSPISSLIGANKQIQDALIAADRLFEIMDLHQEEQVEKTTILKEKIGEIVFTNVDFRYGNSVDVFNDFNLIIPVGKITAFVGESGSGKSTLASILQNLYPIKKGKVTLGDLDLKYIENKSLRKMVCVVPQKIELFAGNVIENIAVGEFQPDMERILLLCKKLGILTFIEELPNGFLTYLGENGATISGGQKQRIAIARAMYKQPEILILDEATSSLDNLAERQIQDAIKEFCTPEKIVILIAHRLSTVLISDNIIMLQKGKIVAEGKHEILMKNNENYSKLWQI